MEIKIASIAADSGGIDYGAHLVSEYLDSAVGSVDGLRGLVLQVLVRVHHHVERVALDPLLGGELCAQTVDTQHQLKGGGGGDTQTVC